MIKTYRKKPVEVQALLWTGKNVGEVMQFAGESAHDMYEMLDSNCSLIIHTLEGNMEASPGDYIIKGVNGEFYPCKPDIFEKTYDEVGWVTQYGEK